MVILDDWDEGSGYHDGIYVSRIWKVGSDWGVLCWGPTIVREMPYYWGIDS